jgi:hypothetical protein
VKAEDAEDAQTPQTVGAASDESASTESEPAVAVLWIPDPTERRGWRDLWIARKKPERSAFGFKGRK